MSNGARPLPGAVFAVRGSNGWWIEDDDPWFQDDQAHKRWMPGPSIASTWEAPRCKWRPKRLPKTDITFVNARQLVIDPDAFPGVAYFLRQSGELLPLAGEAEGLYVHRFFEYRRMVDASRTEGEEVTENRPTGYCRVHRFEFHRDQLEPNTIAHQGGIGPISIEADDMDTTDYRRCGLRAWVRARSITGLRFKKLWDANDPVHDPLLWPQIVRDPWLGWE